MTLPIASPQRKQRGPYVPFVPALTLAMSLACSAFAQEPAPETPPAPPDESALLPEDRGKMPNPDAPGLLPEKLPDPPPPGAIPVRGMQGTEPQSLQEWLENEAAQPSPVTEPPTREAAETSPDLSREVAMNQALSTGDTLLGSLGGLGGILSSPFLAGAPNAPGASPGRPALRPIRIGSLDVNMHASLGVAGTHIGGVLYDDDYAVGGLFQGGISALYGRDKLTTLWFSYDLAGNYPENPTQGQSGREGGSGGFNQSVSLIGTFTFPELRKVKFVFGAKYASLSGIDRDAGKNTKRQIATALFVADYHYSKKTSFSLNLTVPVRQFTDGVSSTGITGTLFADTDLTPKTTIGLGYTFGAIAVENGADQIYHQTLLRLKISPTHFLLFDATTGMDFRDHGGALEVTPIFGLSSTWDSRHGTLVTLAAERRIFNASSAIDTNFTSTSIVLSAFQRFDSGVIATVSAGYEYTEYASFGTGAGGGRTDKLSYLSAGVMVPLALHWTCTLNASAGRNDSDVSAFDFVQTTFKTTLSF